MSALGRFLPVATLLSDRQLLGESRHSSMELICSDRPSLNDRFRLETDGRVIGRRQAAADPEQTFPNGLKRDPDPLIPNQSVARLAVLAPIFDLCNENAKISLPP